MEKVAVEETAEHIQLHQQPQRRITGCWKCGENPLDNWVHDRCPVCGWVICPVCGACRPECPEC